MFFGKLALTQAEGCISAHKLYDANGRILLNKGRILSEADIEKLNAAGFQEIVVARLDADELHEDEAAALVGQAIIGKNLESSPEGAGRAAIKATSLGVLHIDLNALNQLNQCEGVTLATMQNYSLVEAGEMLALVKIIPFAIPKSSLYLRPLLSLRPIRPSHAALIISGRDSAKDKLIQAYDSPVRERLAALDSELSTIAYVPHESESIAQAIQAHSSYDLILLASFTAIMDMDDTSPTALLQAGGTITHFGLPLDPGTMLMLGYLGNTPVLAAPSCIKTPKRNAVDLILPRLLSGEKLERSDLLALAHGGLLGKEATQPLHRRKRELSHG
jgi:molybdenum cofactor cytidylyltransferase